MRVKVIVIILIYATILSCCKSKTESNKEFEHEQVAENIVEMNNEQYKTAGIELGKIENKVLGNVLKVNGIISVPPQNFVSISINMGGFVKSTTLVQGSKVHKGQVLAIIENSEFIDLQQDYLESVNKLEYAEAEYNRQKELFKENVNSEKIYQQAVSEYKTLKTTVLAYEQKLALIGIDSKHLDENKISRTIPIISPIDGYVKTVNVNLGKYISPTDVMFEIVNNQKLTLELTLFEKDIDKVSTEMKIRFYLPDKPENEQNAVIYQVGKAIDSDKTVKVYAYVDNENPNLLPGMYVSALIETTNNSVMALNDEAIVTFDDKNYIFIYKGKRQENNKEINDFIMIEIKKGVSSNGYTEIILPDNLDINKNKIVIKGAYNLLSAKKNAGEMSC